MPEATPDWVAHVIERGLGHANESGFEVVQLEVDRADQVLRDVLAGHGFGIKEEGLVESWLAAPTKSRTLRAPEAELTLSEQIVGLKCWQGLTLQDRFTNQQG